MLARDDLNEWPVKGEAKPEIRLMFKLPEYKDTVYVVTTQPGKDVYEMNFDIQSTEITMGVQVITAGRHEQDIADVTASMDVIQPGAVDLQATNDVEDALHKYSEALGIAYQIRDDLDDLGDDSAADNNVSIRPSIILALLRERGKGEVKDIMEALWNGKVESPPDKPTIRQWAQESGAHEKAMLLLESYKEQAIRSLQEVDIPNLKGLLRRVIGKIFNELEIKGWCSDFEEKNITDEAKAVAAKAVEHLEPAVVS